MITIAFTILIMVIIYHNNRIIFVDKGDRLDPTFAAISAGHIHQHCSCQSKFGLWVVIRFAKFMMINHRHHKVPTWFYKL